MKLPTLFTRKPQPPTPPRATLDLFLLRTGRNTWLAANGSEVLMAETTAPETALLLAVPRHAPQASLLLAHDARPIAIEGDGLTAPAISARLRRVPGGRVELRHPIATTRHLGVVTGAPVGKPNRVLFDRVGDKLLDRFELHPADPATLAPAGRTLLEELAAATHAPTSASVLLALLHAGQIRPELAETLARALPPDELANLARRLATVPPDLALFRRAMPRDPWLAETLPALLAWLAQGRPATRIATSPASEDHVSVLQTGALRPQAGLALTALARRTVSPRRTAALLATARNEGPYILDWLAHHRACGFEHAVIYSNDNDDGSDDLLALLANHDEITWVRNELGPGARAQWKAYGHAFKVLPDLLDFRYTMVLDLDEYVGFRTDLFAGIADLIGWHEHQPTDALALRWLTFTANRLDTWRDAPSTRRFTRREPEVSPLFKSLVRSNMFWDSQCHFPFPTMDVPFSYRLEDGAPCHHMGRLRGIKLPQDAVSADSAWVAHHVYRSAGEALVKATRGDATWDATTRAEPERLETIVRRFVAMADNPGLVTDDRTIHTARTLDAQLTRLRALPGIRACDEAIKQRYATRLAALTQAFLDTPVPEGRLAFTQFQNILRHQEEHRRARAA